MQHVFHLPFVPENIKANYKTIYTGDTQSHAETVDFNDMTTVQNHKAMSLWKVVVLNGRGLAKLAKKCRQRIYNHALQVNQLNPCIIIDFNYTVSRLGVCDDKYNHLSRRYCFQMIAHGSIISLKPKVGNIVSK